MGLFRLFLVVLLSWHMGLVLERRGTSIGMPMGPTATAPLDSTPLPWPHEFSSNSNPPSGAHESSVTTLSPPGPRQNATTISLPPAPTGAPGPHRTPTAACAHSGACGNVTTVSPISKPQENMTTEESVTKNVTTASPTSKPQGGNLTTVSPSSKTHENMTAESAFTSSNNMSVSVSESSWTTNPIGCFRDSYALPRPLPELIADFRSVFDVKMFNKTIEACAKKARERGFKVFGIQFYTECWSGTGAENTYARDGSSTDCENGVGKSGANFVYKLGDYYLPRCPSCKEQRRLCFPAISLVTLESGISITMRQLQIGDRVRTLETNGKPTHSEVIGFLHREVHSTAEFHRLEVEGGLVIRLSSKHLIFRREKFSKKSYTDVYASDVRVGDFLFISDQNVSDYRAVLRISMVTERGVYAPLTEQGTLLVDGALVSCYAHWGSHRVAHLAMAPFRALYSIGRTLQRSASALGLSSWDSSEPNDGLSWYPTMLMTITSLF